jgi:hypothetical protein
MREDDSRGRPAAVKLVVGLLYPADSAEILGWTTIRLDEIFGGIERESGPYPFDFTDYYRDISPGLARRFFSFKGLKRPSGLVEWKRMAIALEAESSPAFSAFPAGRRVNADPGYLDGARIVLASTKDNAHRIYLHDGIFAEVTMCRRKSGWESFSYTFPDFASGIYDAFLDDVRMDWRRDVRALTE